MDLSDPHLARRIVGAIPAIALVLDANGCVDYLNPFGERLTGHALADLRGRDWFELLLPEDGREAVRERFRLVMASGGPVHGGNVLITRDGRRRDIEWSSQRLEDAHGVVTGMLSTGSDVTERVAAETALREREQGFRQLFECNPQAMWIYDVETLRFLDVNDAAVARYGYSRDEFLAMSLADIRPVEDLPALHARLAAKTAQIEVSGGWRHRRQDGTLIEVEISAHPMNFDGRPARMVLADDVTLRREAERERDLMLSHWREAHAQAAEARDLLSHVLERVDDGFVALDAQWHYTYVNSRGARLLGRDKPEDLIGRHVWTEYPEGVGQPFHEAYLRAMREQQLVVLEQFYPPLERWFENRIYPSPEGLSIYFTDITERKQADLARRRDEERLRHFFEADLVGMAISWPDRQWGQFNQRLCDMLGRSAEQMRGLPWTALTHPEDLPGDLALMARVEAGEIDGYRLDKRFIRGDGTVLDAAIAVSCERGDDGRPQRYFAIVEDIGARKQVEQALLRHRDDLEREVQERTALLLAARDEAESANRSKSEFLSHMSHELRTPLNAILGFSQLMAMDNSLGAKHRDFVGEMLRAGRHLLKLINDVLDLAGIESGRLTLSPEALSLDALLGDCLRMVAPLAAARGVTMAAEGLDGVVLRADHTRLRQVLLNLLTNAVKYNRDRGQVRVLAEPRDGGLVRISVTDTGPGIVPQRLSRLFEPFDRLGAEFSEVEGTGVGLTIARQLVERMGGRIGVDPRPGEGACFWVDLPAAQLPPPPAAAQAASEGDGEGGEAWPAAPALTVLCIEDNPANRRLVEQVAARHPGLRLVMAPAARPGLALARSEQPDLILLDIHLPDIDGYAVLAELKADAATGQIPVVAVTADAAAGDAARARAAGFADSITKPVDIERLDALFRRLRPAGGAAGTG